MMRRKMSQAGVAAAALGALGLVGCSDATSPDALDDALLEDVAVVAADATLEDIVVMSTPFTFAGTALAADGVGGYGPDGTFSGARSRTFFDAQGNVQESYDPLTTASIEIEMELTREVSREYWSASVHRTRSMTVSGLLGEETTRQWDGTGAEEISHSVHLDDGTPRSRDMEGTFEVSAVVVPAPGTSDTHWPLSGTIHRTVHVTVVNGPDGDVERDVDVTVTFDGDATATAVVNGETFEIDLTARADGFPLRHRRHHR